jgi:hypothetical protein
VFRLQLEPLETREVPSAVRIGGATESRDGADYSAIAFVGGWGSSMYQYAHTDPAAASVPTDQFALNFTKVEFAEPLPVLMVLADRQYDAPPPAADYLLVLDGVKGESRAAAFHDVVDGRIIPAESGAVRIK